MSSEPPYPYPVSNTDLIAHHALQKHFEGGYFAQTAGITSGVPLAPAAPPGTTCSLPAFAALEGRVQQASGPGADLLQPPSSASASEQDQSQPEAGAGDLEKGTEKVDATQIYYLLTPDSYRGKLHMNLHSTFHLHHAGRALYTLIKQPTDGTSGPPQIHRIIMGPDPSRGEVTQLFVPGGWWKASEIPEEDLLLLQAEGEGAEKEKEKGGLKERIGCFISEVVVPGWNPDQHQFIDEERLKAMWNGQSGWEQYLKYTKAPEGLEYPDK